MFEKVIEFSAHEDYFALEEDYPTPIKLNIPEWYKKLEHTVLKKTVKGCMPFLDSLTTGYLLKMPQDFYIRHNVENEHGLKDSYQHFGLNQYVQKLSEKRINLNSGKDFHPQVQLEGSPLLEKNKDMVLFKIVNPWKIKTPKGYSCLFVPPLNNSDDRFSILSGIVDTDTFPLEVNFPIVINGDKYPVLETIIKKGTPYAQIIPFKRDSWKMTLKPIKEETLKKINMFYDLNVINNYKNNFWNKKSWK